MRAIERVGLESVFLEVRADVERIVRRRVRSPDSVADLVQDLYLKCCRGDRDFPDRREARAYLLRMASNLAIDFERVEGRREIILDGLASDSEICGRPSATPEAYALAADQARLVEQVLASLPKRTREMFVMVRLYGMTHKEVADRLGVSKSLVDKYVLRALLLCRDALGGLDQLD